LEVVELEQLVLGELVELAETHLSVQSLQHMAVRAARLELPRLEGAMGAD
jgi:hypothetical protein